MTTIVNMVNQYAEKIYNQSESSFNKKVQSELASLIQSEQTTIAAIQSESSFNKKVQSELASLIQSEQTTIVNVQSKIFYFEQNYSSSSDTFGLGMSYELIVLL